MCEFDMTPAISISVQPLRAVRESFVEFRYFLPSYVALVSPFMNELMHLIDRLRGTDGSEFDIEMAVREAVVNAVIHGNHEDPSKHVFVKLRCGSDGDLSLTIQDEGAGFDSGSVPDPTQAEHLMSDHGRGIYLMRALMDEVSFEEGGTVVYMRKRAVSPPGPSQ